MNPLLVLVIAAQIDVAVANCTPEDFYDRVCVPRSRFVEWQVKYLPISTRRIEPLVVEPEQVITLHDIVGEIPSGHPVWDIPCIRYSETDECHPLLSELFDVPAVVGHDWQQMFGRESYDPHEEWKVVDHWGYMRWWTCEDTRRALIQAENGTRHCVLLEGVR